MKPDQGRRRRLPLSTLPLPIVAAATALLLLIGCTAVPPFETDVKTPLWSFKTSSSGETKTTTPIPSVLSYLACREEERSQPVPNACRCAKLYAVSIPETGDCSAGPSSSSGELRPLTEAERQMAVIRFLMERCATLGKNSAERNGVVYSWACPQPE